MVISCYPLYVVFDSRSSCQKLNPTCLFQVLNSGGQLQIQRPAPEPPNTNGRTNGGGSNVYQQPHQHINANGTYGEYMGGRAEDEG